MSGQSAVKHSKEVGDSESSALLINYHFLRQKHSVLLLVIIGILQKGLCTVLTP